MVDERQDSGAGEVVVVQDAGNLPGSGGSPAQVLSSISPLSLLKKDLISDPPKRFPALTGRQQAYLRQRLRNPLQSLADVKRAIGVSTNDKALDRSPAIRAYLEAVARHTAEQCDDPAGLRQAALRRLAGIVSDGLDRDSVMAVKVMSDLLPAPPQESASLADLEDDALLTRLQGVLDDLRSMGTMIAPELSQVESVIWKVSPIPGRGTGDPGSVKNDGGKPSAIKRLAPPPSSSWQTGDDPDEPPTPEKRAGNVS